jgi:N-acetylneuraminate synthase
MKSIKLGSKRIAADSFDYYIIAEAGVNHENSFDTALKLIDLAKEGGADAIKFQTYKAGKLACRNSPAYWDTTQEATLSQYELFKKFDSFDPEDYLRLAEYAKSIDIDFMSTPFDLDAVDEIDPLVTCHKVASADLTNIPLLRKIASKSKPVLLSTGASTYIEVAKALEHLKLAGARDIALLHCVLNYPTPSDKAFLSRISTLSHYFGDHVIGYSDHTLPGEFCFPVVTAYTLGARIIEKHFTHDKSLPGNDHYHAMDRDDLIGLRQKLDETRTLLGDSSEELFLASQRSAIRNARRSIVANVNIEKGMTLMPEHLTVKRPGEGISPLFWDQVVGKRVNRSITEDSILTWDALDTQL